MLRYTGRIKLESAMTLEGLARVREIITGVGHVDRVDYEAHPPYLEFTVENEKESEDLWDLAQRMTELQQELRAYDVDLDLSREGVASGRMRRRTQRA